MEARECSAGMCSAGNSVQSFLSQAGFEVDHGQLEWALKQTLHSSMQWLPGLLSLAAAGIFLQMLFDSASA